MPLRRCSKCRCSKPAEAFGRNSARRDGLNVWCKPCNAASAKRYSKTEAGKASARRAREGEKHREWLRAYRQRPDVQAKRREWYRSAEGRAWRALENGRRRSRRLGSVSATSWGFIVAAFCGRCAYCNVAGEPLTIDHVIALSRGGQHSPANVVPACLRCNQVKSASDVMQALAKLERLGRCNADAALGRIVSIAMKLEVTL